MESLYEHTEDSELKELLRERMKEILLVFRCRAPDETIEETCEALKELEEGGQQTREAYFDFENKNDLQELLTGRRCTILNYLIENDRSTLNTIASATQLDRDVIDEEIDHLHRYGLVEFEDSDRSVVFFSYRGIRVEPELNCLLNTE